MEQVDAADRTSGLSEIPEIAYCAEKQQLSEEFTRAVHELMRLHEQQVKALISGDNDFARFDLLIHMAGEEKRQAKYALIAHIETHRC